MKAREIIAQRFRLSHRDSCFPDALADECDIAADAILTALREAGFRVLEPGEVDAETAEECAKIIEENHTIDNGLPFDPAIIEIVNAIRTLKGTDHG